jgi:hypothetical protein
MTVINMLKSKKMTEYQRFDFHEGNLVNKDYTFFYSFRNKSKNIILGFIPEIIPAKSM